MLTRRGFLRTMIGMSAAASAGVYALDASSYSKRPPNIVLILIDDMGWKDIGCMGSTYYQTPHIDKLADDGMMFTQAYSAAPVCSPSRGAIYSGKYPARTKFTTVFNVDTDGDDNRLYEVSKTQRGNIENLEALHRHCLPPSETTFAEALAPEGYKTGFLGKWHCGWHDTQSPDAQGFQFAEGYRTVPESTRGHWGKEFIGVCKGLPDLKPDDYMTDALTDRALYFIEENKDNSFLLVLSHYAVHGPLQAPEELVEKYKRIPTTDQQNSIYAAMVEKVDESVARVVAKLDELGLDHNTAVFFTSDNGGLSPKATSNYPLMGGKSFSYEAGMRVPFIVKWPAKIDGGRKNDVRTVGVDLYPTFLDIAGAAPHADQPLDGVSLMSVLTQDGSLSARPIFFHFPHYTHATGPFSSVIMNDWKLIRFYNTTTGEFQLFNLKEDPFEQIDLAGKQPNVMKHLKNVLNRWIEQTDAELPRTNPAFDKSQKPVKDKEFTWNLALKERREHEERLRASGVK